MAPPVAMAASPAAACTLASIPTNSWRRSTIRSSATSAARSVCPWNRSRNFCRQSRDNRDMSGLVLLALLQILPQSKRDLQKTAAQKYYPTPIELRVVNKEPDEVRGFKIRVYAARDYRDQTSNWQSHFRRLVDRVNQRTRRWPAVQFEVVDLRNWDADT